MSQQQNGIQRVDNPYQVARSNSAQNLSAAESNTSIQSARASQEVVAAVQMARAFPRDQAASMERILDTCTRQSLAEQAVYSYPRGGTNVEGPSIRLAEAMAQAWGNIDAGVVEMSNQGGKSLMMAYCWDLETNVRVTKSFTVEHARFARGSKQQLTDPRDVYEVAANHAARRLRACILAVIPGDVTEKAVRQCKLTQQHSVDADPQAKDNMVAAFADFGVTEPMLAKRIGKRLAAFQAVDIIRLKHIWQSLNDGMSTPDSWFDMPEQSAGAQDLESKLAESKSKPKPETKPEPEPDERPKGSKKQANELISAMCDCESMDDLDDVWVMVENLQFSKAGLEQLTTEFQAAKARIKKGEEA